MVKVCCVKGCNSESYANCGISFHRFPKNDNLLSKWLDALGGDININDAVVCSRHFKKEHFKSTILPRLTDDAVPYIVAYTEEESRALALERRLEGRESSSEEHESSGEGHESSSEGHESSSGGEESNEGRESIVPVQVVPVQWLTRNINLEDNDISRGSKKYLRANTATGRAPLPTINPGTKKTSDQIVKEAKTEHQIMKLKESKMKLTKKIKAEREAKRRLLKKTEALKNIIQELKNKTIECQADSSDLEGIFQVPDVAGAWCV